MVDLIDAEREACADMERLVQEGQASLERDRRAREALETEVQAEEARKHSAEGWDQAWELDPEEVSLSDISVGGGNTSAVYLGFWQHLDVAVRKFEWSGTTEQAERSITRTLTLTLIGPPSRRSSFAAGWDRPPRCGIRIW